MGQIAPAVGADGAANGYTALVAKFTALQHAAAQLLEEAEHVAQRMRDNANAAVTVAELCAAAEVDPHHVAAVADVGEAFGRVVGGCKQLQSAAESMHQAAGHLKDEHQAEYGGIHAAATSSKARQAKPGFYRPL
ncbi:hypothetical protein N8I84_41885 (plasmid) [Streptomyces cynarae]|uniref:Conjugal transfer protein TraB n=1 Tax=Streptomyces cynarae TaxID=2981134 RepID=A0ABY6EGR5_9ACTN|nr:hypothetical protein [Streptomyces cynarae]UXY24986.1 hypothetical protein N8I84_41885 [Streptomyces cynarae]